MNRRNMILGSLSSLAALVVGAKVVSKPEPLDPNFQAITKSIDLRPDEKLTFIEEWSPDGTTLSTEKAYPPMTWAEITHPLPSSGYEFNQLLGMDDDQPIARSLSFPKIANLEPYTVTDRYLQMNAELAKAISEQMGYDWEYKGGTGLVNTSRSGVIELKGRGNLVLPT